ncbi:MAG TPA: carboxypeptidase, partial [Anaerolineae bacterium]
LVRPVEVELCLPEGGALVSGQLRVEAGQLAGRALKNRPYETVDPTTDRVRVEWVVRAPPGSALTLKATHQRAGCVTYVVRL